MSKGINTAIEETKTEIVNLINSKLKIGLPISVIGLIIDNVSNQIKLNTINTIKMESENTQSEANVEEQKLDENEAKEG